MIRYSSIGNSMDVKGLRDHMQNLCDRGMGKDKVQIFDPDSKDWEEITGFTYAGDDCLVRFYCDSDEVEDEEES